MPWQKEIDELRHRQELAKQMGGPERIARQHAQGRLTVRERIDLLLDKDSFKEIGTIAGSAEYDDQGELKSLVPASTVMGYGKINGRPVCVQGGDFTLSGGASLHGGAMIGVVKRSFTEKMALEWRIPLIRLLDEAGGSVPITQGKGNQNRHSSSSSAVSPINIGFGSSPPVTLLSHVPVIGAVLGSVAGMPAIRAVETHWSIMTKNTSEVFVAGPPVVNQALPIKSTKAELGNWKIHVCQSGVVDNVAEDEEDAFRQIRIFLSYLPQNVWQQPPHVETEDDPNRRNEELLSIIPGDRRKQYDIRQLIKHIVDKDSIFELSPFYGRSFVTMLARIDGYPVALMSNDCRWFGGAQTAAACEKMMRFIDFADTFHLPVIYLVDVPGFMIGPESEKEGTLRKAARAHFAVEQATVPWISILLRRSFGVAGGIHGSSARLNLTYAWPSAKTGAIPIEGGIMAAYRREIEAAPDPEARRIELEKNLEKLTSSFRTAETFSMQEIIDPRDTRPLLCEFVQGAQEITATQLGPKYRLGMRP